MLTWFLVSGETQTRARLLPKDAIYLARVAASQKESGVAAGLAMAAVAEVGGRAPAAWAELAAQQEARQSTAPGPAQHRLGQIPPRTSDPTRLTTQADQGSYRTSNKNIAEGTRGPFYTIGRSSLPAADTLRRKQTKPKRES